MKIHEILELLRSSKFVRRIWPDRPEKWRGAAPHWSIERDDERLEAEQSEGDEFVRYRSILRTTDLSRLVILQLHLDREGIRHYRSQNNMLHGGEVQLFVEASRLHQAEGLLDELDEAAG